jgi:predicted Zn-dependent protease
VLLAAGKPAEAQKAFEADLEFFPENGWSLHGLARALRAQGRTVEADQVEARFTRVWEGGPIEMASR